MSRTALARAITQSLTSILSVLLIYGELPNSWDILKMYLSYLLLCKMAKDLLSYSMYQFSYKLIQILLKTPYSQNSRNNLLLPFFKHFQSIVQ